MRAISVPLGAMLRIALAVGLALGAGEAALRILFSVDFDEVRPDREPLRQRDPTIGWVHLPHRVGHAAVAGRVIDYAFNAAGDRVALLLDPQAGAEALHARRL